MKALENTDLLKESIWKSILIFSLPLLVGNLFQQLYNTVDSYVVGNFVSSHALAAVGQSTSIINMLVGFFMGLSTGAGVVIAQYFGAKETKKMQDSRKIPHEVRQRAEEPAHERWQLLLQLDESMLSGFCFSDGLLQFFISKEDMAVRRFDI